MQTIYSTVKADRTMHGDMVHLVDGVATEDAARRVYNAYVLARHDALSSALGPNEVIARGLGSEATRLLNRLAVLTLGDGTGWLTSFVIEAAQRADAAAMKSANAVAKAAKAETYARHVVTMGFRDLLEMLNATCNLSDAAQVYLSETADDIIRVLDAAGQGWAQRDAVDVFAAQFAKDRAAGAAEAFAVWGAFVAVADHFGVPARPDEGV